MPERHDLKSNVKLGRFQTQPEESYVSSHSEDLWYNEIVCEWMTIYTLAQWLTIVAKELTAATRVM